MITIFNQTNSHFIFSTCANGQVITNHHHRTIMWQPNNSDAYFLLFITIWLTTFNQYNFSALQAIDSLYNLKDHVTILETSNFTKFVINQHQDGKKIQLIQFYSSYCGHCISFAPQFKRFLKSVDKWSDLLSISVVNCADDINRKVCSDYKVEYFPTLRMFWFKPNEKDKGNKLDRKQFL